MDDRERRIRLRLKNDFPYYAEKCLKIRTENEGIKPFIINKAQRYLHDKAELQFNTTGKIRIIIVKGRQEGCSTYVEGRYFWRTTHYHGLRAFILTHDISATNNLFEMAKRYYEYCPILIRPDLIKSNAKELIFSGLESGYKLGTAGNKGVGRSSTIQLFHGSEVGFWPNAIEHAKGIMQAIPNSPGTEIFLESTSNGQGNYFHQQWQMAEAGETDFMPIFIPWYWKDEYSLKTDKDFELDDYDKELKELYNLSKEQLAWRRIKIKSLSISGIDGLMSFKQEYPMTAAESFEVTGEDTFIYPDIVIRARKNSSVEKVGPLIIGVDPARFGDDRTAIIRRRGREAYNLQTYTKKDTMEIVGIVHEIIKNENPDKVFVDIGGLGAGIYDRLVELGLRNVVVAINFGESSLYPDRYVNKRCEMWGKMKEWLQDYPCKIPDIDSLHSDLTNPKYNLDSKSRLDIEKKSIMKKRGIRSPDEADALALTFAMPVSYYHSKNDYIDAGKQILDAARHLDRVKKRAYG